MRTCLLLLTLFLLAGCRAPQGEEKVIRYRTPYLEYEQTTPVYKDLPASPATP